MKFVDSIKSTLFNTKRSVRRFPITIGISALLVVLLIYFNENSASMINTIKDSFIRLNMVVGLAIPVSLCIGLFNERFYKKENVMKLIWYIVGGIFLVGYYYFLLKDFEMVPMIRFFGTMIFFILVFFYIPRINKDKEYENYVIKLFSSAALTAIYSGVLYFGLSAILFTIDRLFEANINSKNYYYMFLIVAFIFGVSLFLSKIPEGNESFSNDDYARSLKILLVYIVIPLLTAYNIILYAYFVKILITWQWPKGLVSHLVLWSSAISVGVIFLITPVLEDSKVAKLFKIWFPKAVLPILVMMFMSIWIRVNQYGITENRYYVILLGLWITGIMLYYSLKKPLRNIIVPISLSMVVLISVYGPLSSFDVSIRSQNNRLNGILQANEMLSEGKIVSNSNITNDTIQEISNIISYFKNNHTLNDVAVLPADFDTTDMQALFGFNYNPYMPYGGGDEEYFYYGKNPNNQYIDIKDYDYYVNISSWNNQATLIEGLVIKYNDSNHILTVSKGDVNLIEQDLLLFVEETYNKNKGNVGKKGELDLAELTYFSENQDIKLQIIFTNINGRYNNNSKKINIENLEYILLMDIK